MGRTPEPSKGEPWGSWALQGVVRKEDSERDAQPPPAWKSGCWREFEQREPWAVGLGGAGHVFGNKWGPWGLCVKG